MSRITGILEASSLSDGEIQRLIELLLEKSNANEEWEGVSVGFMFLPLLLRATRSHMCPRLVVM